LDSRMAWSTFPRSSFRSVKVELTKT
jgi:hypothetical protein